MTARVRSPTIIHASPRRIQDPHPLLGRVPCGCPCGCRSVSWDGTLLCMVFSPFYREGPNIRERPESYREAPVFPRLNFQELRLRSACFLVHAGVGLTTPGGVATPGSAAPCSSCFLCLRERCFGPAQMTTTIATTISRPKYR